MRNHNHIFILVTVGIFLLFTLCQSGCFFNNVSKGEDMSNIPLKKIEEGLIKLGYNTSFGFEALKDNRAILKDFDSILENVSFYSVLIHSSLPFKRLTVALDKDSNIFIMPQNLDMVVAEDFKRNLNKKKSLNLAELYVVLSAVPPHSIHIVNTTTDIDYTERRGISPLKYKEVLHSPVVEEYEDHCTIKLFVWGNIGGRLELWNVSITNKGKINNQVKLIGNGIGDFEIVQ